MNTEGRPIMMAKNPVDYAFLLEKIYKGKEVACPSCGKIGLQHHFYSSGKDRIGFAQFQCPHCNVEAHLCRVKFPKGVQTEEF